MDTITQAIEKATLAGAHSESEHAAYAPYHELRSTITAALGDPNRVIRAVDELEAEPTDSLSREMLEKRVAQAELGTHGDIIGAAETVLDTLATAMPAGSGSIRRFVAKGLSINQTAQQTISGAEIQGDVVHGDKVGGDKITVGDISNSSGIAIGRDSSAIIRKRAPKSAEISIDPAPATTTNDNFGQLKSRIQNAELDSNEKTDILGQVDNLRAAIESGTDDDYGTIVNVLVDLQHALPAALQQSLRRWIGDNDSASKSVRIIARKLLR